MLENGQWPTVISSTVGLSDYQDSIHNCDSLGLLNMIAECPIIAT